MIAHEVMAPLMFGGLIVFLLIGYPAAFSLGAVGLFFAVIGIELDFFQPTFCKHSPIVFSAFFPMIYCFRFPSLPSWERFLSAAA